MKKAHPALALPLAVIVGSHQVLEANFVHPAHPDAPRPPKASIVLIASTTASSPIIINTTSGAEHSLLLADGARSTIARSG
jgi:hypothetical protein